MGNFWLQVKVWTKTTLVGAAVLYVIIFIFKNTGEDVTFWWWFGHDEPHNKLMFGFVAFLAGVIITILVRTLWTTFWQVRTLQNRVRAQRLERDVAEMKEKAARLQTRPAATTAIPSGGAFETPDPPATIQ